MRHMELLYCCETLRERKKREVKLKKKDLTHRKKRQAAEKSEEDPPCLSPPECRATVMLVIISPHTNRPCRPAKTTEGTKEGLPAPTDILQSTDSEGERERERERKREREKERRRAGSGRKRRENSYYSSI